MWTPVDNWPSCLWRQLEGLRVSSHLTHKIWKTEKVKNLLVINCSDSTYLIVDFVLQWIHCDLDPQKIWWINASCANCRCNNINIVITYAASFPRITSSVTDSCLLQGQNVTLTCVVTYNGTNLMPLRMLWGSWVPSVQYRVRYVYRKTVNSSSVFQSSYTFTAIGQAANDCVCAAEFWPPTGLVLPDVQKQYSNKPSGRSWSPPHASRAVASELLAFTLMLLI